MAVRYSAAVSTAKAYYDSRDADGFYHSVWGGEDIHVGLYEAGDDSIFTASRRTVARMAERAAGLDAGTRALDIGAGYGGAARYLAGRYGCRVDALNLSEVENRRNREITRAQGLDHLLTVVDGSFEDIPAAAGTYDLVWSHDAILHSGNRGRVLQEAVRVLKPGGEFVFTDPMQADDCPPGVLQPILERIHLDSLGSPAFYLETLTGLGLEDLGFEDHTPQLVTHYARVLDETQRREAQLTGAVSPDYLRRMKKGLQHWVDGGRRGFLTWGIFRFRKPPSRGAGA